MKCVPLLRQKKENMEKRSFVSIDFETMTPALTSACAVGLVKVVDNVIVQKFPAIADVKTRMIAIAIKSVIVIAIVSATKSTRLSYLKRKLNKFNSIYS